MKVPTNDRSARTRAVTAGSRAMACRTLPIRYVVVSLPATTSVTQNRTTCSAVSRCPSSSARRSAEIRSSASSTSRESSRRAVCSTTRSLNARTISALLAIRSSGVIAEESMNALAQFLKRT